MPHPPMLKLLLLFGLLSVVLGSFSTQAAEAPAVKPEAARMLKGDWVPKNPHRIDFEALPRIPAEHVVVSDVRPRKGVNQHNYLIHHDGRYWAMWSDGPGVEDQVGQRVSYSTSRDGSQWTKPRFMTPVPPNSGPDSPLYGTRTDKGWRWISRGFWKRDGELLALASLDEAAGFFGKGLQLRAFRWNEAGETWEDAGLVHENAINNFPPQKLSTGQWMMSRRPYDYSRRGVEFLTGDVDDVFLRGDGCLGAGDGTEYLFGPGGPRLVAGLLDVGGP